MTTLPPPRHLDGPDATATTYDQGAQVVAWAPRGQEPVLWLSETTRLEAGTAIRGGVPLCFPWFGPGRSGERTPSHGPARVTSWRCTAQEGERATYEVTGAELGVQPLTARYDVHAGPRLELALTVTNDGDEELAYEEALHAYLAVGDVRELTIEGLDGAGYADKTRGGEQRRQEGSLRLTGQTDRVYRSAGAVTVVDPVLGRRLRVTKAGSASTIVWNPWSELAATMSDLSGWTGFVCVEGGNVLADEITLAPGDRHTLRYTLEVLPL